MLIDPKQFRPQERLRYICEVMAMRARGRNKLREAERKRSQRAQKRSKMASNGGLGAGMRKHMGEVDDAVYGNSVHLGCRPWEVRK